jgi:bacteriocin-like protein
LDRSISSAASREKGPCSDARTRIGDEHPALSSTKPNRPAK